MSSKIIIIAITILIIASFTILFLIEAKNHDYDYNKSWTVVYFENPRDDSLDFAIENHEGDDVSYGYKILIGDDKVSEGSIDVKEGATQKISPVLDSEKIRGKRILIVVSHKDADYKIYKDLK